MTAAPANVKQSEQPTRGTGKRLPYAMVSNRITGDSRLSIEARLLYVRLASYANIEERNCWPSRATLAEELGGVHPRTVGKWLRELVDAGYVSVTARYRDNGSRTSSDYRLLDSCDFPPSRDESRRKRVDAFAASFGRD